MTLERMQTELAPSGGSVRSVYVAKARTRYQLHGCVAEMTDVIVDGTAIRTIAIEDQDPGKVIAAVRAMKLTHFENTSYPKGLKRIIGVGGRERSTVFRQAVIDVGTNSAKFHVENCTRTGPGRPLSIAPKSPGWVRELRNQENLPRRRSSAPSRRSRA